MASMKGHKKKERDEHLAIYGNWVIPDPGGFNTEDYVPFKTLMAGTDIVTKIDAIATEMSDRIQERISRRVERVLVTAAKKMKRRLNPTVEARVIDQLAVFYEEEREVDGVKLLTLPIIQLFARAPKIIHVIYGHENYKKMPGIDRADFEKGMDGYREYKKAKIQRRNEFVATLICEKYNATLFSVTPETPYTPTLVTIILGDSPAKALFKKVPSYPIGSKQLSQDITRIVQMRDYGRISKNA